MADNGKSLIETKVEKDLAFYKARYKAVAKENDRLTTLIIKVEDLITALMDCEITGEEEAVIIPDKLALELESVLAEI